MNNGIKYFDDILILENYEMAYTPYDLHFINLNA